MENIEIIIHNLDKEFKVDFEKNYYFKSPINYTGNKYRILDQIIPHSNFKGDKMVDLFCGGATFGINSKYNNVILVDNNKQVIDLLNYLYNADLKLVVNKLINNIDSFGLSNSLLYGYSSYKSKEVSYNNNNGLKEFNSNGYYNLREYYNSLEDKSSFEALNKLYLLMIYAFNNDIRFSKSGNFNLPIGKTDFNLQNLKKLHAFSKLKSYKNLRFICSEFDSNEVREIIQESDFVYMDPPYLIANAVYNESNGWNDKLEKRLLEFMSWLISINKPFILSNIIEKKGITNELLKEWINKNDHQLDLVEINYHYRSSSYNKKNRNSNEREIIVVFKHND